jgi:hypothetical protein
MKHLLCICSILWPLSGHTQVWQETFNGLTNGATSDAGATAWTTTSPSGGASTFSKQTPVAGYELFLIDNTGTEGVWQSAITDISSYTEIAIELNLYSNFTYAADYIKCYYKVNGGAEIQFGELLGNNGLVITSAASAIVSGSTLQIIVKGKDNTTGSTGGIINALAFDDVTLTSIAVLYSRSSGNWNTSGSWSTEGFSGATCSCTPNANARVIIGNSNNISIPSAATSAGITIQSNGKLQFTGNTTFTMARGGTLSIERGGQLNNNGGNGSITYGAYTYTNNINGALAINTLTANSGSNLSFTGNGSITATDFLINSGTGRTITLNLVGGVTLSNDLNFQSASSNTSLINLSPLSVANRIIFVSGNVSLTNESTLTTGSIVVNASSNNGNSLTNGSAGVVNVGVINANSGDFTLNNYGTVNQTGNFTNIDAGSAFRNQNGSAWNFSGGGTNTRLYCNFGTNTFAYTAAGAQTLLLPADNYSNLTLAGSGVKTMPANLDINGNLSVTGTAQLDVSTGLYGINLAGNWSITSGHANPFFERTGTVIFDGSSDQTISTTIGTETFYNLTVNKTNSNIFQSSTDVAVANNLTLTKGGLSTNGNNVVVTNSSPGAISRTSGCIISEATTATGQLRWSIGTSTGAFIFPFGKTTLPGDYVPFTFNVTSPGSPVTGTVAVSTYGTATTNLPLPTGVTHLDRTHGINNSTNVIDRFWNITLNGYTTNPSTTVTFVATAQEVGAIANLRAQRWNSSTAAWDAAKPGQTNPDTKSVTVPNVNTFSPWTLAQQDTPLPISLISFNARVENNTVSFDWQTSQEINNDFFTVLKSTDEEDFRAVIKIKGAGTSMEHHSYHASDFNPSEGISYYRLKQTDFNGTETYSKTVRVEHHPPHDRKIDAFPIPCNGTELTIVLSGYNANEQVLLELRNGTGQKIVEKYILTDASGRFNEKLTFIARLPIGTYYLKVAVNYVKLLVE